MNANEIIDFLLPQAEPMQATFFVLIVGMFSATVFATWRNANPAAWEKSWNNGTPNNHADDLDVDHGSVTDLWHAVATKSEKIADVMPGLLLVVGLLGTFLGLGLALNHASNILGQSDTLNASGAASSMQDLMSMMQGLGTKFKTSTWGISFFLLLKLWSSWSGYEEKRLAWVIRKVKDELEKRKTADLQMQAEKQVALFQQISQAAAQITDGIGAHLTLGFQLQRDLQEKGLKLSSLGIKALGSELVGLKNVFQAEFGEMQSALAQSVSELKNIHQATNATSENMTRFTEGTKSIIEEMAKAGGEMADGAKRVGEGAQQVGAAGEMLIHAVDGFTQKFTTVLDAVRTDLSAAINNMSREAAKTLSEGSDKLGQATGKISLALDQLSKDVNTTMTDVKTSIEKSLKIQQAGAVEFSTSSETLQKSVESTTQIIKKLGDNIESGLRAVSDSGRRMSSIGGALEKVVASLEETVLPGLKELDATLKKFPEDQSLLRVEVQKILIAVQQQSELFGIRKKSQASILAINSVSGSAL